MNNYIKISLVLFLSLQLSCASTSQDSTSEDSEIVAQNPSLTLDTNNETGTENTFSDKTIFSSDFESESNHCWSNRPNSEGLWNLAGCGGFINIGNGAAVALAENEVSHSGSKSLKLTFSKDEDQGGAEVAFNHEEHIFTRYYDFYRENFDFGFATKIHRIRSFDDAVGTNNYDIVSVAWGRPAYGEFDMTGINDMRLLSINYNGGQSEWGSADSSFSFGTNRWYCVETEIKLNKIGDSDGLVRIWVDGTLYIEKKGLDIKGNKDIGLNTVMFGGWYSNSAAGKNPSPDPANPSIRYVDDIAIGTERIGCLP